jgi:hypothetical protein
MERETGIEPATNSLEEWVQFVNKEHGVYGVDSTAPKMPEKMPSPRAGLLTEY